MCGLAGFARNPKNTDGQALEMAKVIFEELLLRSETRGKHAAGVAITRQNGETEIMKLAMPASKVIKLKGWTEKLNAAGEDTIIIQGHTRHATQNNAHVDSCAHPFKFGEVTGAHNGMIYNWRELDRELKPRRAWQVDSEAVFDLLSRHKDPQKTLNMLDGYWALTWVKNASVYFVKTTDAVLACAYVPSLQTLFWQSEYHVLESVLKELGLKYEIWGLAPGRLYTVNPMRMDEKSPNAKKRDVTFKGRKYGKYDTSRTNGPVQGGYSTTRRLPASTSSTTFDNYTANNRNLPSIGEQMGQLNLGLSAEERVVWAAIRALEKRCDDLEGMLEVQNAEVSFLRRICDEAGLLEIDEDDDATDRDICVECGQPGATLEDAEGLIHPECVLSRKPYLEQAC